jgi:hypothetical protein
LIVRRNARSLGTPAGAEAVRLDRPNSLGTTVEAKASNRPVKIAYLVPFDDAPHTHMTLDAVFFESYTRWGGAYTLLVPTQSQEFMSGAYDKWLRHYDPDLIYTYVQLDAAFVEKIDRLCCPIAFLKHEEPKARDREIDWRSFLPRLDLYIQPVSSVTTVSSPAASHPFPHERRETEATVLTQYASDPASRFLADNFGTSFGVINVTHEVPGFFKTLCLVPPDLPAHMVAGTERCTSMVEALAALTNRKATPIVRFAMAHSAGISRAESMAWAHAFRLFIGNTPLDRISFWNSRHLTSNWSTASNSLIVAPPLFDDEGFVKQLGAYLNRTNFLHRGGGGPYEADIHSTSLTAETLNAFRDKLKPHTWNVVRVVPQSFGAPAVPSDTDLEERIYESSADTTTYKLTEDSNELVANEPAHFEYMPPQLMGFARGQWVVDLSIQRHNNLSKYSNVIDRWVLPRRRRITRAFTQRLAKPTFGGRLALIPSTEGFPFRSGRAVREPLSFELYLPTDENFFRHLTLGYFRHAGDDLRAAIPQVGYAELRISDKGQNLRGVISMFDHLSTPYEIFTNKFWRAVFLEVKEDAARPLTFERNKLASFVPNDLPTIQKLTKELRFENVGLTKEYLEASFMDTLEFLVRAKVFYQVAQWRCKYCGHANSRSFDNMKIRNKCDICETEYLAPIDIQWQYELSEFVYRSLQKHSGRPVLWTLGHLQDASHDGNFWYLPEVDLYERDDDPESKNEIDIICMLDGVFHAVEAKATVSTFLNKAGAVDKFAKVIERLRPDVALLAFERYCAEGEDAAPVKAKLAEAVKSLRERLGIWTKVEVLIAQDIQDFNEFPASLGWYGRRVRKYH